nr:hypothetical protein [Tanacetum cinerariifolium]
MVKNLKAGVKFFMFPRFVQVFVNHQLGDMSYCKKIFSTPSLTKKVFANMKREGKGFSGIITPLFETMMVQAPEEEGEGSEVPTNTHHTPIVTQPSSSQPQKKEKSRRIQRKETEVPHTEPQTEEIVPTTSNDPLPSGEDRMELTELMTLCTNLQKQVLNLEKAKTAQAKEIADLKKRDKESLGDQEDATKQGRMIDNIDQDEEITLVDETHGRMNEEEMFEVNDLDGDEVIMDATAGKEVKQSTKVVGKEVSTADPVTTDGEVVTTAKDVEVTTTATTPQIYKNELTLSQTLIEIKAAKPKARGIIVQEPSEFRTTSSLQPSQLLQAKDKEIVEEMSKKTQAEEKLDEQAEAEVDNDQREAEMKMYMKIIPDNEIAIDAISLATKPPIIVDWKIIKEGKISSYHLIRANGTKYGNTRPEEGYERVLWGDMKVMFEHDIESEVWRKLQGNKVIIWKLFSSCGVHFVRFQNLHIFMLVEKRYLLTHATITEMLNRKLQADH